MINEVHSNEKQISPMIVGSLKTKSEEMKKIQEPIFVIV